MTRPRWRGRARGAGGAALVVCAILGGCGDDRTGPTMASLAGPYEAGTLRATGPDGNVDLLRAGSMLVITLDAGGSMTGRLRMPPGVLDEAGTDAELAGSWSLVGETVRLSGVGGTFLQAVEFRPEGRRLVGAGAQGDLIFTVVLIRVSGSP